MLLTIVLTFIATSCLYGVALWFACWRVCRHLRGNAYALSVAVEHVLIPILGSGGAETPGEEPERPAADILPGQAAMAATSE